LKRNRRKRGGQKGNQNARKHGFYSPALSPAETADLWTGINIEGVDPHVALVRVKLLSSLQHDPTNRRVLAEASRLLARAYSDMYSLDTTDHDFLKTVIDLILESAVAARSANPHGPATPPTGPDETNRSYPADEHAPGHDETNRSYPVAEHAPGPAQDESIVPYS